MTRVLRVGVLGAGVMGRNHLRTWQRLKGIELVGVHDPDRAACEEAARQHGCRPYDSAEALARDVEAVSVVVPSVLHAEVAVPLLRQGIACLVEKPLATSEQDCLGMMSAASASGTPLLVGHVERFNPVVQHLAALLEGVRVHAVDVRRMSSVSSRITDVDVVADLMVHDLDIVRALMGGPPLTVGAVGVEVEPGTGVDYATASLTFAQGRVATVTSSRITQNKVRQIQVTSDLGSIGADLLTRELLIHRQSRLQPLTAGANEFTLDMQMDRVFVRDAEPLLVELSHFAQVAVGAEQPLVTGEEALASMRMVWDVQAALEVAG
jgi:predicted dehydrogenase